MGEIRPVTPDRSGDRLSGLGMRSDLARKRQQPFGNVRRHIFERDVFGDRRALVAALDIRTEASGLERYAVAELGRAVALRLVSALAELLRIFAVRIV